MIRQSKCGHCPLADDCRPCKGQNNHRFCVLTDPGSPDHRTEYLEPERLVLVAPPPATSTVPIERVREAQRCPYRDCKGCGCDGCRCGPGGRREGQVVAIDDCLACIEAAGTATAAGRSASPVPGVAAGVPPA